MSAGFNRRWIVTYDERQVAEARERLLPEIDRLYRQERGMRLAANSHDHYLAEQDRKEGY